jgi:hypothetical protein
LIKALSHNVAENPHSLWWKASDRGPVWEYYDVRSISSEDVQYLKQILMDTLKNMKAQKQFFCETSP